MKRFTFNLTVSLFALFLMFACSEKNLFEEDLNLIEQEIPADYYDENFVSSKQALEIAEKFFSREEGAKTRAFASAKVETVKDEKNNNTPAMYVVNYPEGGWAIISATIDYCPILAYSDEGSFEIKPEAEMGGVVVWLEETKEAIRVSNVLDEETKDQIRSQWQNYETNDINISSLPQTRNYTIMNARIDYLSDTYGGSGWKHYMSLDDARGELGNVAWQNLIYAAEMFNSPSEYTIIGMKKGYAITNQVGPLLSTIWHQGNPFNALCNGWPAGCVPVSLAQIMKLHKKPSTLTYNGYTVNWNNMDTGATIDVQTLIRAVGNALGLDYNAGITGANDTQIWNALSSFGYSFTFGSHNAADTRNSILNYRPVSMGGDSSSGGAHQWVCDGIIDEQNKTEYFVEFFTGSGYNIYGYYTMANPGTAYVGISRNFYSMKWGEVGGQHNGWYENNVFPSGYNNYSINRTNFYNIR